MRRTVFYFRIISLAVIITFTACRNHKKIENATVAIWKNHTVDAAQFKKQYITISTKAPIRDSYNTRKRFAIELIKQSIHAEKAEELELDTIQAVQRYIKLVEDQAIRRTYLQSVIQKQIPKPTEEELKQTFDRKNKELNLEQIYASTKQEADSIRTLINRGQSFETLAKASMRQYRVPDAETAWKMGWVSWDQLDIKPESTAYSLKKDEISKPVESANGWHIFRLVGSRETIRLDDYSYETARENLAYHWNKKRFDERLLQFIDSTLKATPLILYNRLLYDLEPIILPIFQNYNPLQEFILPTKSYEEIERITIDLSEPVAVMNDEVITLSHFLDYLPLIPKGVVTQNIRSGLEFMLKDKLFADKGRDHGFANHPDVKLETQISKKEALYRAYLSNTLNRLDRKELSRYYFDQNSDEFKKSITAHINAYHFPDSNSVWEAIRAYQQNSDWESVLHRFTSNYTITEQTIVHHFDLENYTYPLELRAEISTPNSRTLTGPYPIGEHRYTLIEITNKNYTYYSIDEIEEAIDLKVNRNLQALLTNYLLPEQFNEEDVQIDSLALNNILPVYFPSDF